MKKIAKYTGNTITILAVVLITKEILLYDWDWSFFLDTKVLMVTLFCTVAYTVNVSAAAFPWMKMLEIISNRRMPVMITLFVSARSNLLKYIPGNFFQYIGKNELAIRCNIGHGEVAMATLLDVCVMLGTALILGILCIRDYFLEIAYNFISPKTVIMLVFIGLICCLSFTVFIRRRKKNIVAKIDYILKNKNNWKNLVLCILYYVIQNFWVGMIYVILLTMVSSRSIGQMSVLLVIGANVISGVIGFVTPGAPGGLGIREIIMALITKGIFPESSIMVTSVIFRTITIAGDMLAFLIVFFITKTSKLLYDVNIEKKTGEEC